MCSESLGCMHACFALPTMVVCTRTPSISLNSSAAWESSAVLASLSALARPSCSFRADTSSSRDVRTSFSWSTWNLASRSCPSSDLDIASISASSLARSFARSCSASSFAQK